MTAAARMVLHMGQGRRARRGRLQAFATMETVLVTVFAAVMLMSQAAFVISPSVPATMSSHSLGQSVLPASTPVVSGASPSASSSGSRIMTLALLMAASAATASIRYARKGAARRADSSPRLKVVSCQAVSGIYSSPIITTSELFVPPVIACEVTPKVSLESTSVQISPPLATIGLSSIFEEQLEARHCRGSRAHFVGGTRYATRSTTRTRSSRSAERASRRKTGARIQRQAASLASPTVVAFDASRLRLKIQTGLASASAVRAERGRDAQAPSANTGTSINTDARIQEKDLGEHTRTKKAN
jgi:hypothetical protein